jgi:hypothetical protein
MSNLFDDKPEYREVESFNDTEKRMLDIAMEWKRLAEKLGRPDLQRAGSLCEGLLRLQLEGDEKPVEEPSGASLH